MKEIRIFIASSCELVAERNELAFLVLAKEEEFAQRGLRVRLAKWEYVDPKMTAGRTEDRYLEEMYNCDAAMVIFKDIAGMYTREELDKALARESAANDRIKTHKILFSAEGKPDSDAAKLRAMLLEENYGVYANLEELKTAFLSLVDEVAKSDRLVDTQRENMHEVSAFVAADDELASDCNAFADTILNLNEILARRGIRVRMRFYDPGHHRELLESSEMALVLYDTNYKAFGPDQMQDAYERTKREENPKRLYVFFRDEDESKLDQAFLEFRNGFAENLGHFFCRFENADTLKLNFLLSLENLLGDGVAFIKLDGKKVKADELEVAEITKLPMVANNSGLCDLRNALEAAEEAFSKQKDLCKKHPDDDLLYDELLRLSAEKNNLQNCVDRELTSSFSLAKRMAAISVREANEAIVRAHALMNAGNIKEALEVLDGSSSSMRRKKGLRRVADMVDEQSEILADITAQNEVDYFRAEALLTYAVLPFQSRFDKAKTILEDLIVDLETDIDNWSVRHRVQVQRMLAGALRRFAGLYDEIGDTLSPLPLLERALKLYQAVEVCEPGGCRFERASVYMQIGKLERENNQFNSSEESTLLALDEFRLSAQADFVTYAPGMISCLNCLAKIHREQHSIAEAEREFSEALEISRKLALGNPSYISEVARNLGGLAILHGMLGHHDQAERELVEVLDIRRKLASQDPEKFSVELRWSINNLAVVHHNLGRLDAAEKEYIESLEISRRIASQNPAKFDAEVASGLENIAAVHRDLNRLTDAEREYVEAIEIYRRLSRMNPSKFEVRVAGCVRALARLHQTFGRVEESECEFLEALKLYRRQASGSLRCQVYAKELESELKNLCERTGRSVDDIIGSGI